MDNIITEFMDPDIRAALFEDEDEEGGFEALDDDFVMQVMQEPEKPDFDFEAHIARLIELRWVSSINNTTSTHLLSSIYCRLFTARRIYYYLLLRQHN